MASALLLVFRLESRITAQVVQCLGSFTQHAQIAHTSGML